MDTLVVAKTIKEGEDYAKNNNIPRRNIWTPRNVNSHRGKTYEDLIILGTFEMNPQDARNIAFNFTPQKTKRQTACYQWLAHKANAI